MKAIRAASHKAIKKLCEEIAREYHPQKIILFGSHACGKPQWDMDDFFMREIIERGKVMYEADHLR